MKFSNFLFPESKTPDGDFGVIEESLREAELTEELGYEVLWLAEHHFDGGCAYVDPITFASAIAARTSKIKNGFAVAQMALHHPIRFAEQIALIDNISRGRMIVGVGRGTAYNFYERLARIAAFRGALRDSSRRTSISHRCRRAGQWQAPDPQCRSAAHRPPHRAPPWFLSVRLRGRRA